MAQNKKPSKENKLKIRAIAFSDLHLKEYRLFNEGNIRVHQALEVLRKLDNLAHTYGVPLLFGGDLFHDDEYITNYLLSEALPTFKNIKSTIYGIDGNHDQVHINNKGNQSPSYFNTM